MNEQVGCDFNFDCVVVSRVSLNKKRAKRNLQKIAHTNTVPARQTQTQPARPTQQRMTVPEPRPAERQVARAVLPVPAKTITVQQAALSTRFSALPDAVLSCIFSDVAAVGACAVVCRDLHRTVWSNDTFWHGLRGLDTGKLARESYRRWTFDLDGDWAMRFMAFAQTAEPVKALERAARLTGGLTVVERKESDLFIEAVCVATRRADETEQVVELLDTVGLKVAQRENTVFRTEALDRIGDAREDVLEKGILARLDAAVDRDMDAAFDPFEPEAPPPAPWVVDGPVPALVFDTPAEQPKPRQRKSLKTCWADMESDDESTTDEDDDDFFSADGSLADDEEFLGSTKVAADFADEFLDLLR
jgi:hypothetical protein